MSNRTDGWQHPLWFCCSLLITTYETSCQSACAAKVHLLQAFTYKFEQTQVNFISRVNFPKCISFDCQCQITEPLEVIGGIKKFFLMYNLSNPQQKKYCEYFSDPTTMYSQGTRFLQCLRNEAEQCFFDSFTLLLITLLFIIRNCIVCIHDFRRSRTQKAQILWVRMKENV